MNIDLGYHERDWQRECALNMARFTVLALHRRAGKTELAVMRLIHYAMKCNEELGLYAYICPLLNQARAIAWERLKQRLEPLRRHGMIDISESDGAITFKHNGAKIRIFGGDNPDRLRGLRLDGCVIDEVAQIKPEVWVDIVQPALSDRLGWSLFIGTPQGINLFSELYFAAPGKPQWHAARYTVYDTHAINESEVERLKRDMSETSFSREYLCDFTAAGDDQLISLSDCEVASRHIYQEHDVQQAPRILGVDPARFGDDRSVIFSRQGLQAFKPEVYRGIDNMELAARVAAKMVNWSPDAVFVDAGAGAGVIDRLRQLGHDVVEVPFGGRATRPDQFLNRRAEMWWEMAEWLKQGGAIPNDNSLKQELATPTYWYDASGRKVLEPKDDIKKRLQGGGSPDMADALALTFAYPVQKRIINPIPNSSNRQKVLDYSPYG